MMTPDGSMPGRLFLIALCSLSGVWEYRWTWMETSGFLNWDSVCGRMPSILPFRLTAKIYGFGSMSVTPFLNHLLGPFWLQLQPFLNECHILMNVVIPNLFAHALACSLLWRATTASGYDYETVTGVVESRV
ncbi:hypothetical protein TNCV_2818201 [Trichonephila clavipes]|nr:hypothetical protein TNCV_2818201 [Trichonephila clavipes]